MYLCLIFGCICCSYFEVLFFGGEVFDGTVFVVFS